MSKSLQKLFIILSLFMAAKPVIAQDYIVDYTYLGSYSQLTLSIIFQQTVDYGVDLYKIRYKTTDIHSALDTASGLIVIPQVPPGTQLPVVVYEHGTIDSTTDVPSRLRGGYEAAMAYAAFGFATFAPDYIGLGDSRGFHPWLHAASEASASLDMLFAGYEFLEFDHPADVDPNYLFLSGYSQGGHASMALHKLIDDYWSIIIPVTAAAHMSGIYSISGVLRDGIINNGSGDPGYLANLFLSYNEAYNLYADIGQIFKEPYATSIRAFYNHSIPRSELSAELIAGLAAAGETIPNRILQDSILDAIIHNPNHPLNLAMQENDTYNWAPSSPTRLYYCQADETVPFINAIIADSVMHELGATDVQALDVNPNLTHVACAYAAIPVSIAFFKSFIGASGTKDVYVKGDELTFFPNPTTEYVSVDWSAAIDGFDYRIINTSGITVDQGTTSSNHLSLSKLPGGLYMIVCTAGDQTKIGRVLRQ
ncbi:MAG: T9SS type A sorting domain-containing protein [Saprospiraceae bacterium]